jgi:hypothetical protein
MPLESPWPRHIGFACLALLLAGGCRADRPAAKVAAAADSLAPADSLALSTRGIQVWYTLARTATSSQGITCTERALEIRRNGRRVPVPLLYTGSAPVLLDDTTMRAVLWTQCRPTDAYLVDLRTGRPVRDTLRKAGRK